MVTKRILLTSVDPVLLETRKMLLAAAGYSVFTATSHPEVVELCKANHFDLLVLGHTIPAREKKNILNTVREACGEVPSLELRSNSVPIAQGMDSSMQITSETSPAELVSKVNQILRTERSVH